MSFVKCNVLSEHIAKLIKRVQHLLEGPKAPAEELQGQGIAMCFKGNSQEYQCVFQRC